MLTSILKSALVVVEAPVAVVADVVTLGGALNDKDKSYTEEAIEAFVKNVSDVIEIDK